MATSSAGRQLLPSYKQHSSVDDRPGVIVDIEVVTGEESDFGRIQISMLIALLVFNWAIKSLAGCPEAIDDLP